LLAVWARLCAQFGEGGRSCSLGIFGTRKLSGVECSQDTGWRADDRQGNRETVRKRTGFFHLSNNAVDPLAVP
jgi:hypothetical protein